MSPRQCAALEAGKVSASHSLLKLKSLLVNFVSPRTQQNFH